MAAPLDDRSDLGTALAGRYTLGAELGRGGMATVYLAHDCRHDRPVALKVLRAEQTAALGAERFSREIKLLARLRHPFVLPLHDSGEAAGVLYFVMPYIDGESLRARLVRDKTLPIADAIGIVRQVADALDYAHGEGVVHRDVKPENILLSRHGHALLADFGIARGALLAHDTASKLTQVGLTIGTAAYMSPEQALGESDIDGRADVYSLGCVLYEMLAGEPPFTGATALSLVAQHLGAAPPSLNAVRPALPRAVIRAVERALHKEPAERYATAAAFAHALVADDTAGDTAGDTTRGDASAAFGATRRLSIAVLPVTNAVSDAETEFFSDGMTEELINALAKVEGLRVVSRTSTFAFKGTIVPVGEIGAQLDVGFVVEANVRRAGRRLRVTARLVDVGADATLWSETYERQLEDIFAVQDDITGRIVDTITRALQLGHLRGAAPVQQPRSLEAYDLYLLGRHHWYQRTEPAMRRALELFQQAADADSSYAPAYSGIADASALLASWQFASPGAMYPRAANAARRALELDPSSADAHASLGFVKLNWEWDWDGAERDLRRAIALNPSHETAHRWLSAFLAAVGRADDALPLALRALELNPISALPRMNLGIVHFLAHRYAEALAAVERVIDQDPGFVRAYSFLSSTLALLGRFPEAAAVAELGAERSNRHPMVLLAVGACQALSGRLDEARATFEPILRGAIQPLYEAMIHALLGEEDSTLDALERGYDERSDWMYSITTQPWFLAHHAHPRFLRLVDRMRLPPTALPRVPARSH